MWHAWERRENCTSFRGKARGKETAWKTTKDGIRMDLRETGLGGVDWIQLAQDIYRWQVIVSVVINLRDLAPRS
jgi:hypothetical protein